MKREMIRKKQKLSESEIDAIMERNTNGVMSVNGDDGYPYGVPLSYVWHQGKIYFHTGDHGYKLECIRKNPKVSFAVVDMDEIVEEEYTTYFRSVIARGTAREAAGEERIEAFLAMAEKYSASMPEELRKQEVEGCSAALIVAIDVEEITGKEAIELVEKKAGQ